MKTKGNRTMTGESLSHAGGCSCRQLRYRMTSKPMIVHCCHCSWCQRETGSAFAVNALIEADRVELTAGTVDVVDTPSASGQGQRIARCPKCRVALWSHYAMPGIGDRIAFVRVGTLDAPGALPPDIHIFTSSRLPWVVLPPEVIAVPEYYKASERWSKESLARRAALSAAAGQSSA